MMLVSWIHERECYVFARLDREKQEDYTVAIQRLVGQGSVRIDWRWRGNSGTMVGRGEASRE